MENWWNAIPGFEKIFWVIALPTTFLTFVQIIMSTMGMGDTDGIGDIGDAGDAGMDVGGDTGDVGDGGNESSGRSGFNLFSLRNMIIMAASFGWAGISGAQMGFSKPVTIIFAAVVGLLVAVIVAGIFYLLLQLQSKGNTNIVNAVDEVGTVYLPIPAEKAGTGMVQIPVQGSIREYSAMTEGPNLATGTKIRVLSIIDKETVMVAKI